MTLALILVTVGFSVLTTVLRIISTRNAPPPPVDAPRLGWIIPGVLPGDVSRRGRNE